MIVNFKCPKCNHDRLEEISYSVAHTDEIFAFELYDNDVEIEYAPNARKIEYSAEADTVYECAGCGFTPERNGKSIRTAKDLYVWLKKRKMLR